MGRPREIEVERITTTLRIDRALLDRIDAEARRREVGRNRLLVWMLEAVIDEYEAQECRD